jgi:3-mercaptopropionate dioxygenase
MSYNQATILGEDQRDDMSQAIRPEMCHLVDEVRSAVAAHPHPWEQTARVVADALSAHLPSPVMLSPEQRLGDADHYCSIPLYVEPDTFSIVALVWRPGQKTPIHNHLTWCVFGVIQGEEYEELFKLNEDGSLDEAGVNHNPTGSVAHLAPPGDIHRVRNKGKSTAISIHIYGIDVRRMGSSVRQIFELEPATKSHIL